MIIESEYFEDENEDLEIVKNMKRVNCKVLVDGYNQTEMAFYLCSCDQEQKNPICEQCSIICHAGHILGTKYFDKQVCSCGKKNHILSSVEKFSAYNSICKFNELIKKAKINIYYRFGNINSCFLCKIFCFKDKENNWIREQSNTQPECDCQEHTDIKFIYKCFNDLSKMRKIENLSNTHLLNAIIMSKNYFESNYLCLKNFFQKLLDKGRQFNDLDSNIIISNQYIALSTIANLAIDSSLKNYFDLSIRDLFKPELLNKIIENPFNEELDAVWIFKNNMLCCYEKLIFDSDMVGLSKFKIADYANFSPIQRIIFNDNARLIPNFFTSYIEQPKNIVDMLIIGITNLIESKKAKLYGYDILLKFLNILKQLVLLNLFKSEQQIKFCNLVDEILKFLKDFISKTHNIPSTLNVIKVKEMLILECICKIFVKMSINYNDNTVIYLLKNTLKKEKVKFFHFKNNLAKGITRNCINILNYTKLCSINKIESDDYYYSNIINQNLKVNSDQFEYNVDVNNEINKKEYNNSIKNVLRLCTQIIGLCLNNPDFYIIGMKRLLSNKTDLELYTKIINGNLSSNEKGFVVFLNNKFLDLENDLFGYYNFNLNIKDLTLNTIKNIESFFETNQIEYKIPIININYSFDKGKDYMNDIKFNPNHRNLRVLMNKSSYLSSISKVLSIFNEYSFEIQEEKYKLEEKFLELIMKLFYFYIEDNADNSVVMLSKIFSNSLVKVNNKHIVKIISFQFMCFKWIIKGKLEIENSTLWKKFSLNLYKKSLKNEDNLDILYLFLKIIRMLLLDIASLTHSITRKKIRKALLIILKKSKCIVHYFEKIVKNLEITEKSELIDFQEKFNHEKKNSKIFYKFLKVLNDVFDDNTYSDSTFLSQHFNEVNIKLALRSINLNMKIRSELLRLYRIIKLDVSLEIEKLPNYIAEISSPVNSINHSEILNNDQIRIFIFLERLLCTSKQSKLDNNAYEILIFELKNFQTIIEATNSNYIPSTIQYYLENGLLMFLRVFLTKNLCIAQNLKGKEFLKIYEITILFLYLKLYLYSNQNIHLNLNEEKEKSNNFLKCFEHVKKNKTVINWKKFSSNEIESVENDIKRMSDYSFQALDFISINDIVEKHFFNLIQYSKSLNFNSLNIETAKNDIDAMVSFKNKLNTTLEMDLCDLIYKYENLKNNFEGCSLFENLDDVNVLYERKYRTVLIKYLFFICENDELIEECFSKNSIELILKILQNDKNIQEEVLYLINKNEINLKNLLFLFFKHVLSIIFKHFNPNSIDFNNDYKTSLTILKIFSFLCNNEFQYIFLNLEIPLPAKSIPKKSLFVERSTPNISNYQFFQKDMQIVCAENKNNFLDDTDLILNKNDEHISTLFVHKMGKKIRFFDLLIMLIDKILLLSNWTKRIKLNDDREVYFLNLYNYIIEFLIKSLQNLTEDLFKLFIRKREKKHVLENEYFIENENDNENYIYSLEYFISRSKDLLFSEGKHSEAIYTIKNKLVSLLLAFLEEKLCPSEITKIIIQTYFPKKIIYPIINTLKDYLRSKIMILNETKDYDKLMNVDEFNKFLKFDKKNYKNLLEHYYNSDFSKTVHFKYSNTLYSILKLFACKYDNCDALFILNTTKTHNDDLDFSYQNNEIFYVKKLFEKITKIIWVKLNTGGNSRVIFTIDPLIYYLSENTKRQFYFEEPRENGVAKLKSLLFAKQIFMYEINYNYDKIRSNGFLRRMSNFDFFWVSLFNSSYCLFINIYMIAIITDNNIDETDFEYKNILLGLHIPFVVIIAFFIFLWFYSKFSLYYRKDKKYYMDKNKLTENDFTWITAFYISFIYTILGRAEIVQMLWNIIWGTIGLTDKSKYFCFSIALLSVIGLSETLKNIVIAFKLKWKDLLATFIFSMTIVYVYSELGYYYLKNDFLNNENHNMCETLAQCYFTFILDGLRKHGGIGDIMKKYSLITSPGHYMARFFFDFSFFIIVVVILLNIVFGIIIDTFRDLRQYLHRKEKDILTVCFICGLNIDELERKNKNFEQHTEEDHNIWNYVYYMIGLELTNRNDMNAINSEVYEKIKKMEISWFPYENDNSSVEDN